jgi:hypothetical protein
MAHFKQQQACDLRTWTQFVEIAKLEPDDRGWKLRELAPTVPASEPGPSHFLANAIRALPQHDRRYRAILRCIVATLAVERYRLAHDHWPDSLGDLVPAQLRDVPTDPFDGKPLRYLQLDGGVVIYSVGPDGQDDGGTIDRKNPNRDGTDIGFRLWDVPHRRQPPPDPEVPVPPPPGADQ